MLHTFIVSRLLVSGIEGAHICLSTVYVTSNTAVVHNLGAGMSKGVVRSFPGVVRCLWIK